MPNINEFVEQCSLLGIDHIEVVPDGTPGIDDSDITSVSDILKRNTILQSTFNNYKEQLKNTNIVYFLRGTE